MQLEIDFPAPPAFAPVNARWESPTRWYALALEPDLFGTWILTRQWGSRSSRLFGVLQQIPASPAVANATVRVVERRRARSGAGYERVA